MAKTNRIKLERETFFGFNDEEGMAWVCTTSPTLLKKLTRRIGQPKQLSPSSWSWEVPKDWIKLPNKKRKRVGKPLTKEHKVAMQEGRKREKLQ